jgi:transcriptional regulator with XRE-family HTH domain
MAGLSPADRREVEKRKKAHLKAMEEARRLDDIRRAADKKQGEVAQAMGIGQNAVSQLERRSDLQLSTLNRYVESIGFRLEIAVVAPSGERVALKNFRPWEEVASSSSVRETEAHPAARRGRTSPARKAERERSTTAGVKTGSARKA